jgi:uncharacterized protein YdhG (YjbR/CyaY superfamily)
MKSFISINTYIAGQPKSSQVLLKKVRATIKKAAPKAEETISYGIPTFTLNGRNLVHFGGFKKHIGFFPAPSGINAFKEDLDSYEISKGTVKFLLDHPLPLPLIAKIVKFRVKEETARAKARTAKK